MTTLVIAVLIVIFISALCSGTEAALFSVPIVKVQTAAQSGKPSAKALAEIRENMMRPIAAIVILNNIANILGSIEVGLLASNVLGNRWLGLFSGIMTFLVIVFSEIIPKTIGETFASQIAFAAAIPTRILTTLFLPVIWILEILTFPITRNRNAVTTNESEIRLLARIGKQQGAIEEDESRMIQRVFLLNDKLASDIMTPRIVITAIEASHRLKEVREKILHSQHTRIVVIGESIDEVKGIAIKSELLAGLIYGRDDALISEFTHPVKFVPQTMQADDLLELFLKTNKHIMMVLDEFGGISGVVTLEDVLEIVTGEEIVDESDLVADLQEYARKKAEMKLGNHGK